MLETNIYIRYICIYVIYIYIYNMYMYLYVCLFLYRSKFQRSKNCLTLVVKVKSLKSITSR